MDWGNGRASPTAWRNGELVADFEHDLAIQRICDSRSSSHAIMSDMRQLITRIDDELHARIKDKAISEGRSVNELVRGLLEAAVVDADAPRQWKRRMIAAGKVVAIEPERDAPGRTKVAELLHGAGPTLSEHLDWSRDDG